ncbi:MAG: recombinase family protein [Gemmata sp.]
MSKPFKPEPDVIAYSYLRFSSPEQAKGDSTRRQTSMTEAWCERNGVHYDSSLSMRDEGVSAFTGEHRKNPDRHALAGFLELVRQGKIARGSLLVVENLDRLSREDTVAAVNLFSGILLAGVRIVQLDPESVYTDKSDSMDVMRAVLEMSRGHSESANKSRRMTEVWAEKRKKAREAGAVMSRSCPAWLRVEGTGAGAKYAIIPRAAETIRRVFRLTIDGHGARSIVKIFNSENVPPISRQQWGTSYIRALLRSRATFGEYTPRTRRSDSQPRKAVGSPIADYYPAVIDADTYYAAQAATQARRGKSGRPGKQIVNVFAGLLWDARSRGRLHLMQYQRNGVKRPYIVPYAALERRARHIGFPLDVFEGSLLDWLDRVDPRAVLPTADGATDEVVTLEARQTDIDTRLARIKSRLRTEDEVDMLLDLVRELDAERRECGELLAAARARAVSPTAEAWGEFRSVRAAIDAAPDPQAARIKLRGVLRRMVKSVWCLFMPGPGPRLAYAQVLFAGDAGERWQDFVIAFRRRVTTKAQVQHPAVVRVLQLTDVGGAGQFDLRDASDARALEAMLDAIGPAELDALVPSRNERVIRSKAAAGRRAAAVKRNAEWRKMRANGMSYGAIATAAGVSTNTVFVGVNGRRRT